MVHVFQPAMFDYRRVYSRCKSLVTRWQAAVTVGLAVYWGFEGSQVLPGNLRENDRMVVWMGANSENPPILDG